MRALGRDFDNRPVVDVGDDVECLAVILGRVLDEGQCGFRRFRGCADATFVLRRLFEEVRATRPPLAVADGGTGLLVFIIIMTVLGCGGIGYITVTVRKYLKTALEET